MWGFSFLSATAGPLASEPFPNDAPALACPADPFLLCFLFHLGMASGLPPPVTTSPAPSITLPLPPS